MLVRAKCELQMGSSKVLVAPAEGWRLGLEIVFSSRDGYVWASWQHSEASVRLGRLELVAAMMQDFLAQDALGKRLEIREFAGSARRGRP